MQNTLSLNDLYDKFMAGCLQKKDFEADIFQIIRKDIHRLGLPGWNSHDYDDFISWLSFRIGRTISAYRETGSTFETYIGVTVRLAAKEYRALQIRDYVEESAAWMTQLPEMYAYEHEPEYDEPAAAETAIFKNPRQLLILILKCSNHVAPDSLERFAPRLGIKTEELAKMIDCLRRLREKRERTISALREKTHRQFYRCIFLERTLDAAVEETMFTERVRKLLERGRKRLKKLRVHLAGINPDPSNQQIANILGVSKGTVDSALCSLRAQWNKRQKNTTLI